ncbi:MAG: helix-turn-helix domain-containing protein [Zavarzinella sp.]
MVERADALTRFIILPENVSAHETILHLAESLSSDHDFPLVYIFGPPGTGKTHLGYGLTERVQATLPGSSILQMPANEFSQWKQLPLGERQHFRKHLLDNDLLIIDDLQHLPLKVGNDLALLLDKRANRARPTVLLGNGRLGNLDISGRLSSRLQAGLMVEIAPLSLDSRLELATQLCLQRNLRVDSDLFPWLARHPGGARGMISDIRQLEPLAKSHSAPLTLAVVQGHLNQMGVPDLEQKPRLPQVLKLTSHKFGVTLKDLQGPRRLKNIVWARQIAMYLARQVGCTFMEIGHGLGGRDHTTIMHGCDKIAEKILIDRQFALEIRNLLAQLPGKQS